VALLRLIAASIPLAQGAIDSYLHDSVTYCICRDPSGTGSDGQHLPRINEGTPLLLLRTPTASANAQRSDAGAYRHHSRRQPKVWAATRPHGSACDLQPRRRKLDEVLDWCGQLAIPAVTLWVFSTENFERPTEQVSGILAAIEAKMRSLAEDPQIHRQRVRVQAIGKLKLLPASTLAAIGAASEATAGYNGMILTIAVAYGGREEIADAVQALLYEEMRKGATLADAIERITPAAISRHLYMAGSPDPDLIIRTSGEIRLSGFLLWQSVHSEFYFSDVYWPAFRKIDFLRAVRAYQQRKRRFGR
jgi:short-chain Z-isoprenyl diphosphate synthase